MAAVGRRRVVSLLVVPVRVVSPGVVLLLVVPVCRRLVRGSLVLVLHSLAVVPLSPVVARLSLVHGRLSLAVARLSPVVVRRSLVVGLLSPVLAPLSPRLARGRVVSRRCVPVSLPHARPSSPAVARARGAAGLVAGSTARRLHPRLRRRPAAGLRAGDRNGLPGLKDRAATRRAAGARVGRTTVGRPTG
jgi:hypothetical protein